MKIDMVLVSAGVVVGRFCPDCDRPTIRVEPGGLFFPVTMFPRHLSSRYCDTCDKRRLHVHVEGSK